jgi:hypothetical protein
MTKRSDAPGGDAGGVSGSTPDGTTRPGHEPPPGYRDQVASDLADWKATHVFDAIWGDFLIDRHRHPRGSHWRHEAAEVKALQ